MKYFCNKLKKNYVIFYVFLCLFAFIFNSADLLKRNFNKRNKFNSKTFSKGDEPKEEYSSDMEIIYGRGKVDSYSVIIEMKSLFTKSGLIFINKNKNGKDSPFLNEDKTEFFIPYGKITEYKIQHLKNDSTNKLQIIVPYRDPIKLSEFLIHFIFDFGSGTFGFGRQLNDQELEKFLIKALKRNKDYFITFYKEKFQNLRNSIDSLNDSENEHKYFQKIIHSRGKEVESIEKGIQVITSTIVQLNSIIKEKLSENGCKINLIDKIEGKQKELLKMQLEKEKLLEICDFELKQNENKEKIIKEGTKNF